jgi:hypothetical protein
MKMSAQELKSILHESIENIDDEAFLLAIREMLERKYTPTSSPTLTEWQIERIEKAKKEMDTGNFLTNEQADELVEKWLSE